MDREIKLRVALNLIIPFPPPLPHTQCICIYFICTKRRCRRNSILNQSPPPHVILQKKIPSTSVGSWICVAFVYVPPESKLSISSLMNTYVSDWEMENCIAQHSTAQSVYQLAARRILAR